jgi:hypothetical protein
MESVGRNMAYAATAAIPAYIPPEVPLTAPTPVHPAPEPATTDTTVLLERDITSPPPNYPLILINPPTYKSSESPPAYSSRRRNYEPLRDTEGQVRRNQRGMIARLVDWRCIGMLMAVVLFIIVCVVVIIVRQREMASP